MVAGGGGFGNRSRDGRRNATDAAPGAGEKAPSPHKSWKFVRKWPVREMVLGSGAATVHCKARKNSVLTEIATVAVAIRMKRMGRKNRAYYRICATDRRSPRDGRVIEELGTYDPAVPDTDARVTLDNARLDYWLSVGAKPSDAVRVLIKKYGAKGTRVKEMEMARAKLKLPRIIPDAGAPVFVPEVKAPVAVEAPAEVAAEPVSEAPAAEGG